MSVITSYSIHYTKLYDFWFIILMAINLQTSFLTPPFGFALFYETPSGRQIWTHTSLSPVLNDNGEIIHLVAVDSDISKRKEAGDALIERVDKLTRKIGDLSLQQRKLMDFTNRLIV